MTKRVKRGETSRSRRSLSVRGTSDPVTFAPNQMAVQTAPFDRPQTADTARDAVGCKSLYIQRLQSSPCCQDLDRNRPEATPGHPLAGAGIDRTTVLICYGEVIDTAR